MTLSCFEDCKSSLPPQAPHACHYFRDVEGVSKLCACCTQCESACRDNATGFLLEVCNEVHKEEEQ